MPEQKPKIEPFNLTYSRILSIAIIAGLFIIIVSGLLYFSGVNPLLDIKTAASHWQKPVSVFWRDINGDSVHDYSWFLFHLNNTDSIAMLGIGFLALTPLIGILCMIRDAGNRIRIFLIVLAAEFLFSIIQPIL